MKNSQYLNLIYQINQDCNNLRGFDMNILLSDLHKKDLIKKAKIKSKWNEDSQFMFYSQDKKDYITINVPENKNIVFWIHFLTLKEQEMTIEYTRDYINKATEQKII